MRIRVLAFGLLTEKLAASARDLEVHAGATAMEAAATFLGTAGRDAPNRPPFAFAINERYVRPDAVLCEGDVLALIPPVSGG